MKKFVTCCVTSLLLAGAFAGESRRPTGSFALGKSMAGKQPLSGYLRDYLSTQDLAATIKRSVISSGNQARFSRVMEKAMAGKTVTIGVIGGSITQGAGSSKTHNRYADLVKNWWAKSFPTARIKYVNAGIGGTPSRYGVFRANNHLLKHKPDVVIIDFAVNDLGLGGSDKNTVRYMEGLIRKVLNQPNQPAVMLLFFASSRPVKEAREQIWQSMDEKLLEAEGKAYGINVQNYQIPLGEHYGLPMISFRDAIVPLLRDGTFKWHELIRDTVHPNDFGHGIAAMLVTNYLDKVKAKVKISSNHVVKPVPKPYQTAKYEHSTFLELNRGISKNTRAELISQKGFKQTKRGLESTGDQGAIEFSFDGNGVYLAAVKARGHGKAFVTLSNKEETTINMNAGYKWQLTNLLPCFKDLKSGRHTLKVITSGKVIIGGVGVLYGTNETEN
jgi:lysophospholipase L1-like esterase